jgi:hypothetical protein
MRTPSYDADTVHRLPRLVVRLATSVLPRGQVRARYRRELDAELHALPRRRQLSFALGVLRRSWELRIATTRAVDAALDVVPRPRRPVGCALNLRHRWRLEHTDDGTLYRRCQRCGKDDDGTFHPVRGTDYGYGVNITSSW